MVRVATAYRPRSGSLTIRKDSFANIIFEHSDEDIAASEMACEQRASMICARVCMEKDVDFFIIIKK